MTEANEATKSTPQILIIEDDIDQRELVSESLGIYFDSEDQSNARNIIAVGSAAECNGMDFGDFDAILLDYNLPDATGLEILQKITASSDTPVIFVTGENVIETASAAMKAGAQDYLIKMGDYLFVIPLVIEKNMRQHAVRKDNLRLQRELEASVEEVRVKNEQLHESLEKMQQMANTDYLTGLINRRYFADLLDRYFSEAGRYSFDLTCIMIDLDHYKIFNDTLGHQMGDKILVETSRAIQDNLRASDVAARYGGDEFVLLLPHTSVDLALTVSERIRQRMYKVSAQYSQVGKTLSLSMGLSNLNIDKADSADGLVAMADQALYAAKAAGKDRLVCFSSMEETLSPASNS